jgi:hypothetical protein
MIALFDYNYRQAKLGQQWHEVPPGLEKHGREGMT